MAEMMGQRGSLVALLLVTFLSAILVHKTTTAKQGPDDLLVLSVATEKTDGLKRYLKSAEVYKHNVKVLGMAEEWKGGDVRRYPGGGQKIRLLKKELEQYKEDVDKVIMFTDGYDVIITGTSGQILEQFYETKARILFGAETTCWPDESLAEKYPKVKNGKRFLNSGGFIGYASDLFALVSREELKDDADDQLFYTSAYLDEKFREKHGCQLDHRSTIFQNLNFAMGDVELQFRGKDAFLQNTAYGTVPLVVLGNGAAKVALNSLGNYLAKSWNAIDQCVACQDDMVELENKPDSEYPVVTLAVFVEQATPFFEEFLVNIANLVYPKSRIDLFIHLATEYHSSDLAAFLSETGEEYRSFQLVDVQDDVKEWHARNAALEYCEKTGCEWLFTVDAIAHLDNPHTLRLLVEQNRDVVAPLLIRPYKAWSNFWGALTSDGFYARAPDYMEIVTGKRRGVWNVPYVTGALLVRRSVILGQQGPRPSYIKNLLDPDMAFCENLRDMGVFMFVSNRLDFGHLVDPENFETNHVHDELYEIVNNRWDWEKRYMHTNYSQSLQENATALQPCPDVFWFPIVTDRYCDEMIEELENFGRWSDGSNQDERLPGGYENVPTVDIHMRQVGFHGQWLYFLDTYVKPLQQRAFRGYTRSDTRIEGGYESVPTIDIHLRQVGLHDQWLFFLKHYVYPLVQKVFQGYEADPPTATMNFVVRYKPDEQPSLRPHHDSSTYTINIALNRAGIDFEGGGCRFDRYNCSVTATRKGWMMLHPGRLTHLHEGLPVTKGVRYIQISFVDP